jgi:ketosteroid isomerase-like protein
MVIDRYPNAAENKGRMNMSIGKHAVAVVMLCIAGGCALSPGIDREAEKAKVIQAINDHIKWPLPDKNVDRLYASIVQDSTFFIFHPDSKSTIVGIEPFRKMVDAVFMNPACKPTRSDIRDLRVTLSTSGDVAWFSAILDDYGEWDGQPYAWLDTRWTGVLEKRDGKWLIDQMHFSFAKD